MRRTLPSISNKTLITLVVSSLAALGVLLCVVLLAVSNNRRAVSTLTMRKSPQATAATYNGAPIIEACNIVTFDELRSKGIKLAGAQYPDTFVRTYIEGTEGVAPLPEGFSIKEEPNSCHYQLRGRRDLFDIAIYQPAYSEMKALETKVASQYNVQPGIGDTKVYKAKTYHNRDEDFFNTVSTNEGNEDFILQQNDTVLWFRLYDFKPSVREEVLRMVAANFSKLLQKPEARATIGYQNSPVKDTLHRACELLTAESARKLIGQNLNPVVKEGYAGAPGTRNYKTSHGRPDSHVYVAQKCERSTISPNNRLTMELRQYASEEGAKHYIQAAASGINGTGQQWQATGFKLGDEAYVEANDDNSVVHVRKGALVLTFTYHLDGASTSTSNTSVWRLEPVVTGVLERVTSGSRS